MKRYKNLIPFFVFLTLTLFLSLFFLINLHNYHITPDEDTKNLNKFSANNVVINKKIGNDINISLYADSIIYRKRTSDFFDYQNLREIYIENAEINIFNNHFKDISDRNFINRISDSINVFCSDQFTTNFNKKFKKTDSEAELLSRILFKNITLRFYYPARNTILIKASNAEINYNIENIVLNENVIIKDSKDNIYYAKTAVFSEKYNGIYFPDGFHIKKYKTNKKEFYAVNNSGRMLHSQNTPEINYVDLLSKKEKELFIKLVKKLPLRIKILLGISNV